MFPFQYRWTEFGSSNATRSRGREEKDEGEGRGKREGNEKVQRLRLNSGCIGNATTAASSAPMRFGKRNGADTRRESKKGQNEKNATHKLTCSLLWAPSETGRELGMCLRVQLELARNVVRFPSSHAKTAMNTFQEVFLLAYVIDIATKTEGGCEMKCSLAIRFLLW